MQVQTYTRSSFFRTVPMEEGLYCHKKYSVAICSLTQPPGSAAKAEKEQRNPSNAATFESGKCGCGVIFARKREKEWANEVPLNAVFPHS